MDIQMFNWYAKGFIRKILTKKLELMAKLKHKSFRCKVLEGTSGYDFSINSDMSVSCNCQDFDGAGKLGDFSKNSLEEILNNDKSRNFRKELALGKLPIPNCSRCTELEIVPQYKLEIENDKRPIPNKNLMVENTICCACSCLACARPMVMKQRNKLALTLEDIEKISLEIKKNNIQSISYFNLGDPFISKNILEELKIIRKYNPDIIISSSTNGLFLDSDEKLEAACLMDLLVVSIDGINNKIVRKYQRNQSFEKAFGNMCNLVKYRDEKNKLSSSNKSNLKVGWNYILFSWNDKPDYIKTAIRLCEENGIDSLNLWHTKSPFWATSWRWYIDKFYKEIRKGSISQYLPIEIKK